MILDTGLTTLKLFNVATPTQGGYAVGIRKLGPSSDPVRTDPVGYLVNPVPYPVQCPTGPGSGYTHILQDSWAEGWHNREGLTSPVNTHAVDWSWWKYVISKRLEGTTDFSRNLISTQGVSGYLDSPDGSYECIGDQEASIPSASCQNGADHNLTDIVLARNMVFSSVAYGSCGGAGPPAFEGSPIAYSIMQITDPWSRTRFPAITPIDNTLYFNYGVTLYPPIVVNTQVVNVNGVDYTFNTRAYYVGDVSGNRWSAGLFGGFHGGICQAIEATHSMPALDAQVSGSTLSHSSSVVTQVGGEFATQVAYTFIYSAGNFATGIGTLLHGATYGMSLPMFITTISPKLPKTSSRKLVITFKYAWDIV